LIYKYKKHYPFFTDNQIPYALNFSRNSNIFPIEADHPHWAKVINEWIERGIEINQIIEAINKLRIAGMDISSPSSITKTAISIKANGN